MSDRKLSQIRTRIGMVFQHFALWPHLSVLRNPDGGAGPGAETAQPEVHEEALALLCEGRAFGRRRPAGAALRRPEATGRDCARAAMMPRCCCCSTSRPARSIRNWSVKCWR